MGGTNWEFPLDPHHTHFLLVDDGAVNTFASEEARFRKEVESTIPEIETLKGYGKIAISDVDVKC